MLSKVVVAAVMSILAFSRRPRTLLKDAEPTLAKKTTQDTGPAKSLHSELIVPPPHVFW